MPQPQRKAHAPQAQEGEREPESGERQRREAPLSHEPEMESELHLTQMLLLLACIRWWWRERKDFFAAGNLSIYYPARSRTTGRTVRRKLSFRGPDFFIVLDAEPRKNRNSWVVRDEGGKYPNVIVEILSPSTAATDRGEKKAIYEQIFKTPNYFLFDPSAAKLEGYRLDRGKYVAIEPDSQGRLWSEELGMFLGVHDEKLRMFMPDGELVPLPEESALEEKARAERAEAQRDHERAERERAERERAAERAERERVEREKAQIEAKRERAEREKAQVEAEKARLAAKLRALGVDPDALD